MAKQRHDLGVQKRIKSEPARRAAYAKRMAKKMERIRPSAFYEAWLKYNRYRPYYYGDE